MDHVHNMKTLQLSSSLLYNHSLFPIVHILMALVSFPNDYHHILADNEALRQTILLVLVYSILAHTLLASLSSILYNHELHLHNAWNILVYPMTIWLAFQSAIVGNPQSVSLMANTCFWLVAVSLPMLDVES